ncbi:MAG: hypothetical protein ACFFAS_04810 [Promethearchaeota archaeon]
MISISSAKLIRQHVKIFCVSNKNWDFSDMTTLCDKIEEYITKEYEMNPEKERKGKGVIFITKHAVKEFFSFLVNDIKVSNDYFLNFAEIILDKSEFKQNSILLTVALFLLAEFIYQNPGKFEEIWWLVEKYASHHKWAIREAAAFPIVYGLKKNPDDILKTLFKWGQKRE